MPSTEAGKDLYLILTTILAGLPLQLWLLFSSYCWLILFKGNGGKSVLISKLPAFLHVSAENLQESGLEMCESILKFVPYCMVA